MDVVVNVAVSADGKLSTRRREQVELSGPADFDRVDRLRADSDAVMVGVGTVLADDPSLTVDRQARVELRRERGDPPHPARVVADSTARTPPDARVLDDAAATYVLVSEAAPDDRVAALREGGTEVLTAGAERVDLAAAFERLERAGVDDLMMEGGGELVFSAFEAGLVDRLSAYVAPVVVGGRDAPTLADGEGFVDRFPELTLENVERIDDGVALFYTVGGRPKADDAGERRA